MTNPPTLWPEDNGARGRARELLRALSCLDDESRMSGLGQALIRELLELAVKNIPYWKIQNVGIPSTSSEAPVHDLEQLLAVWDPHFRDENNEADRYKVYIPLEIVLDPDRIKPTQFSIWGLRFFFRTRQSVDSELDGDIDQSLLVPLMERNQRRVPPTVVTCMVSSRVEHNFWGKEIAGPFAVLRGLLELATADLSLRSEFQLESQPAAVAPHPEQVMWIPEDGGQTGADLAVHSHRTAVRHTIHQEHFDDMRRLSQPFTSPVGEGTTESVASTALQLYASAMDAMFDHGAFLSLWQCAEVLVHSDNIRGQPQEIGRRINWILEQQTNAVHRVPRTLKYLADIRNPLVHEGRRELVEAHDVNTLKAITENVLRWYIATGIPKYDRRADLEAHFLRIT